LDGWSRPSPTPTTEAHQGAERLEGLRAGLLKRLELVLGLRGGIRLRFDRFTGLLRLNARLDR
jgi:hypothetical protein